MSRASIDLLYSSILRSYDEDKSIQREQLLREVNMSRECLPKSSKISSGWNCSHSHHI